jgi:hypothetical protein
MKKLFAVLLVIALCLGIASVVIATPVYDGSPIGTETFSGTSTGIESTPIVGNVTTAGDNIIANAPDGSTYKLFRIDFMPVEDVTGLIEVRIGDIPVYQIVNATGASTYGKNIGSNFNLGADGADLILNVPAGADVYYNGDGVIQ